MADPFTPTCKSCKDMSFSYPEEVCKLIREIKSLKCVDGKFEVIPPEICRVAVDYNQYRRLAEAMLNLAGEWAKRKNLRHAGIR